MTWSSRLTVRAIRLGTQKLSRASPEGPGKCWQSAARLALMEASRQPPPELPKWEHPHKILVSMCAGWNLT